MTDPKITPNDTVLADLTSLKNRIDELDEVLNRENFDHYERDEVSELCGQIEQLTIAIKNGVENNDY